MKTDPFGDQMYPPEQRWLVLFRSSHRLIRGGTAEQNQRRFFLADSAEQALAAVRQEVRTWDGINNMAGPLSVHSASKFSPWNNRFTRLSR